MSSPNFVTDGLILHLHAAMATGTGCGTNSPPVSAFSDLSSGGHNGTLENFGYIASSGWNGDGSTANPYNLCFDGVDDFVQVTSNGINDFSNQSFTIEAWTMPTTTANRPIFSYDYTSSASPYYAAHLRQNSLGITFAYNLSGTPTSLYHTYPSGFSTANYNHIVATFTNGYQAIYVNGSLLNSSTNAGTITYYQTPVNIGKSVGGSSRFLGNMVLVRYYNRALSASEILQNYNSGMNWPLDAKISCPLLSLTSEFLLSNILASSCMTIDKINSLISALPPTISLSQVIQAVICSSSFSMLPPTLKSKVVSILEIMISVSVNQSSVTCLNKRNGINIITRPNICEVMGNK